MADLPRFMHYTSNPRVIMTLLVKNEADIIAANLEFHHQMGVDGFIVTDNESYSDYDAHINMLSLSVPVNVTYKYTFSNGFYLAPFVGIHFRTNLFGKKRQTAMITKRKNTTYSKPTTTIMMPTLMMTRTLLNVSSLAVRLV